MALFEFLHRHCSLCCRFQVRNDLAKPPGELQHVDGFFRFSFITKSLPKQDFTKGKHFQWYRQCSRNFLVLAMMTLVPSRGWMKDMSETAVTGFHHLKGSLGPWSMNIPVEHLETIRYLDFQNPHLCCCGSTRNLGFFSPMILRDSKDQRGIPFWIPFRRIGEAKCPGPEPGNNCHQHHRCNLSKLGVPMQDSKLDEVVKKQSYLLQISIANPTSINGRSNEVCSWGNGIHFLAETACTQQTFRKEARVAGHQSMTLAHGQFPKPMTHTKKGAPSAKGQCKGVGVITSVPHRMFAGQEKLSAWKECRLVVLIFSINNIEVLGIGAYFFHQSYPDAAELNNEIHEQIADLISSWRGPTFVAADFNCDIRQSHWYQTIYHPLGMCDIRALHDRNCTEPLPPTTEGKTITDTILVSNWFAERFHSAFVRSDTIIPTHSPVHAFFQCDNLHFSKFVWALPAPFPCSHIDAEHLRFHAEIQDATDQMIFDEAIHSASPEELFVLWSEQAESCFAASVKSQHDIDPVNWPFPHLKDRFFGRGKLPERVETCPTKHIKPARRGDFQPSIETTDIVAKQKVKQVRRIQSLWNRMNSQAKVGVDTFNNQNIQEWKTICTSVGYGRCFLQWLLHHSDLEVINYVLPTCEQLKAVLTRVKADADRFMRGKGWQSKKSFEKNIEDDWKEKGGKMTFGIMADKPLLGFNAMKIPRPIQITKSKWCSKGILSFRCSGGSMPKVGDQLEISKNFFEVVQSSRDVFAIKAQQFPNDFYPKKCDTHIHTWEYSPDAMAKGFFTYWSRFWMRDDPDESDQHWEEALKYVESIPICDSVDLTIDCDSLEQAIQSTPSNSARGLCGWSIRELKLLPRNIIRRLATLLNLFAHSGWPKIMTWVRLALPPKCSQPSKPEHGRPICVMSIIYRIGAKVIARKLLHHLSSLLPNQICGGVPGRDATFVWYSIQAQIERAHFLDETLIGFCLDIQKCYNAIPRRVVIHALIRAGVPESIAWSWYTLLMNLHRSVVIQNSASEMVPSTTGIPEGDPIAVPTMAIICWIFWNITKHPDCVPWTYADNWEFVASSLDQLSQAVKKATAFMQSWKLEIDEGKCWTWSSKPLSKVDNGVLASILQQPHVADLSQDDCVSNPCLLNLVKHQKDLGATMRYRKILSVSDSKERFQKSISRIRRLLAIPCSLECTWRAINVGAISCALYGIELLPLGWQHFQKLRSSIADTVCETYKNRSEWLASACTHSRIGDPEVVTIKKCIRLCRKFLVRYPELINTSFDLLHSTSADAKRVFGPLGCLKRWFTRLGWKTTDNGCVITEQNIVFSLLFSCPDEIAYHIDTAWSNIVTEQVSHRKGMNNLPSLNFRATSKHLQKFCDVDQRIICKYISGAFAHGDKNIHRGTSDGTCQYCKNPDSLYHRIHSCSAFSEIRSQHADTLHWINHNCQHWNATPIIPHHPDEARWGQIRSIVPSPLCLNLNVENMQLKRFFTDGSCRTPLVPAAAFAAWSVVEDLSENDVERRQFAEAYRSFGVKPSCFQLSHRSQTRGRQTNDRAELSAVIFAVSQSFLVEIFTDSTYAIGVLTRVLDGISVQECINDTNSDLIQELIQATLGRSWTHIAIRHVRSHQDLQETSDMLLLFHQLGNDEADRHAGMVWDNDTGSTLQQLVQAIYLHYTTMAFYHIDFLTFLCKMCKSVSDLKKELAPMTAVPYKWSIDNLKQWKLPEETRTYNVVLEDWMSISLPHPSNFVRHVSAYFNSLEWPVRPQQDDVGVSWLELFVDCVSSTACRIPNQRGRYSNQYIFVDSLGTGLLERDSLNQMISTFRSCAKFLGRILQHAIFPTELQVSKCESLLCYTGGMITSGFSARPKLLLPALTIDSIRKFHDGGAHVGKSTKFVDTFPFDVSCASLRIPDRAERDPPAEKRINHFGELQRLKRREFVI